MSRQSEHRIAPSPPPIVRLDNYRSIRRTDSGALRDKHPAAAPFVPLIPVPQYGHGHVTRSLPGGCTAPYAHSTPSNTSIDAPSPPLAQYRHSYGAKSSYRSTRRSRLTFRTARSPMKTRVKPADAEKVEGHQCPCSMAPPLPTYNSSVSVSRQVTPLQIRRLLLTIYIHACDYVNSYDAWRREAHAALDRR